MKKKREKASIITNEIKDIQDKFPFEMFFAEKVKEGKVGKWQIKEIFQFFQDKGLTNLEYKDKYEELLKLY